MNELILHLCRLSLQRADHVDVCAHLLLDDPDTHRVEDDEEKGEEEREDDGDQEFGKKVDGLDAGIGHAGEIQNVQIKHIELLQESIEFRGPGHGVNDVKRGENLKEGDRDLGLAPHVWQIRKLRQPGRQVTREGVA